MSGICVFVKDEYRAEYDTLVEKQNDAFKEIDEISRRKSEIEAASVEHDYKGKYLKITNNILGSKRYTYINVESVYIGYNYLQLTGKVVEVIMDRINKAVHEINVSNYSNESVKLCYVGEINWKIEEMSKEKANEEIQYWFKEISL